MSEDRIERETLIAAPLERVWSLVAEPGFWVADKASLPGTVAREGESMVAKNAEYGDFPVRVEKVQPPTYLAYRWASAFPGRGAARGQQHPRGVHADPEGDKTRLRVVESGFAALAGSEELRSQDLKDQHRRLAPGARRAQDARRTAVRVTEEPRRRRRGGRQRPRRAGRPDATSTARPARRTGRGHRDDARRTTPRLAAGGGQAPRRPGRRRAGLRQPGRTRGAVRGAARGAGRDGAVDGRARGRLGPAAGKHQARRRGGE